MHWMIQLKNDCKHLLLFYLFLLFFFPTSMVFLVFSYLPHTLLSLTIKWTHLLPHIMTLPQSLTKGDCSTLVRMSLQSSTADGVSVGRLDVIKKQYSDLNDCSRETLKTWLRTCVPPPTWMNIVEVLRSRTVDATRLAAELERKYCSSRHDSPPPLPTQLTIPHLPPSDALQIEMTSQHPVQPAVAAGM